MEEMINIIKDYVVKNSKLDLNREDIKDESNLIDDFGYDSFQMIQLVLEIEEHFNFMFEEEDLFMDQLLTFGAFKNLIIKVNNKNLKE